MRMEVRVRGCGMEDLGLLGSEIPWPPSAGGHSVSIVP